MWLVNSCAGHSFRCPQLSCVRVYESQTRCRVEFRSSFHIEQTECLYDHRYGSHEVQSGTCMAFASSDFKYSRLVTDSNIFKWIDMRISLVCVKMRCTTSSPVPVLQCNAIQMSIEYNWQCQQLVLVFVECTNSANFVSPNVTTSFDSTLKEQLRCLLFVVKANTIQR